MVHPHVLHYADYLAAMRLHVRHDPKARFWFLVWQRVMPVISIIAIALLATDMFFLDFSYSPLLGGVLAGLAWIGFYSIAVRPFLLKRAYRSIRPELDGDDHPVELELADGQLISRVPGRSEGRFERAAITDFAEDDKVALFYVGKKRFLYVPKAAIPDSGWIELRQWISGP